MIAFNVGTLYISHILNFVKSLYNRSTTISYSLAILYLRLFVKPTFTRKYQFSLAYGNGLTGARGKT